MKVWQIGIVGCGVISRAYVKGLALFDHVAIAAVADLNPDAAAALAAEIGCPALEVDALLDRSDIDIVLNLTIPKAHAEVDLKALAAGKHAYSEKPLAVDRGQGRAVVEAAAASGLRLGCAPDTFLGGGQQTARHAIDQGMIGEPVAATAFMLSHGHEAWHPAPEFFYEAGGGPMLDMGPYYLTALVHLMGPIRKVSGMTRITFPERTITSQPLAGKVIRPEVPTHYAGTVEFHSGAIGTIIQSFDVWGGALPRIEVYGTEGSLGVPDPNTFQGPVTHLAGIFRNREWTEVPLTHSDQVLRGIGLADMAHALTHDRPHRAGGDLAHHVLEVMELFRESSALGRHLDTTTTCSRPEPLPIAGGF